MLKLGKLLIYIGSSECHDHSSFDQFVCLSFKSLTCHCCLTNQNVDILGFTQLFFLNSTENDIG